MTDLDPFHDHTRCPWCSGQTRHATSDEWPQSKIGRVCDPCNLIFTRGAKREWDDPFFNPNLRDAKAKGAA